MKLYDIDIHAMLTDIIDPKINIKIKTTKKSAKHVIKTLESSPSYTMEAHSGEITEIRVKIDAIDHDAVEEYRGKFPFFKFGFFKRCVTRTIVEELKPYVTEKVSTDEDKSIKKLAKYVCTDDGCCIRKEIDELYNELDTALRMFVARTWPTTDDLIDDMSSIWIDDEGDDDDD